MSAARLTTDEAAAALSITSTSVQRVATRRGWAADAGTWSKADVEAERLARRAQTVDGFTKEGAEKLADTIRAYWSRRGRTVKVWVEPGGDYSNILRTGVWFVVRSDLIDGRPRK